MSNAGEQERARNMLGRASSPYLRQHASNPVHWQEWSSDALEWARERDVPILLSIGYASCHWCHVMAHESFEDELIAAQMNRDFVCIKVDREERPDLDAIYMNATVAMTGQGGWPMTCFLTPGGEPFYCGTYFPARPRGSMPTFPQVLSAISGTWRDRRDDVHRAAGSVTAALRENAAALPTGERLPDAAMLDAAAAAIIADEDTTRGGFGGAPKFPPSAVLEGLLRHYERTGDGLPTIGRAAAGMARGGIYDQLAGGFSRYAVDADWVVPHFEKMLYDNALLLRFYAHLARCTGDPLAARVARETAGFLLKDLRTPEGGFASAFDADTEGVEGLTYAWTSQELMDVLGLEDGLWAASLFAVGSTGTFEGAQSVLQLPGDPDDEERFARVRATLRAARDQRPQPERDDKVVTAWNGLAITALVEAGLALDEPDYVQQARVAAEYLLATHVVEGRLRRASLGGSVGDAAAVLDDHGALAVALLALYQATGEDHWRARAEELADIALLHFADPDAPGSWFDTADDAEALLARPRDPLDGATPSGASTITEALLSLAVIAEPEKAIRYREHAEASLARAVLPIQRAPRSAGHWFAVAEAAVHGPIEIAISTTAGGDGGLLAAARKKSPGGAIVVAAEAGTTPPLADRPPIDGQPAAYVCRGTMCQAPVGDSDALAALLTAADG